MSHAHTNVTSTSAASFGNHAGGLGARALGIQADVKTAPAPQPLLADLLDRLSRISSGLSAGVIRVNSTADRVLGLIPSAPGCGNNLSNSIPSHSAAALSEVVDGIAQLVERLHEAASRVERIG